MRKYQRKPKTVQAYRVRKPTTIGPVPVAAGDWIVQEEKDGPQSVMKDAEFLEEYAPAK